MVMEFIENDVDFPKPAHWQICVLISEHLCPDGNWLSVVKACIDGGVDAIQLREKNMDGKELLERSLRLVDLCKSSGVDVIINDRLDIALLSGADGVHLGQTDIPAPAARKLAGEDFIIGISTARLGQAKQALVDGADYCGVGPMFASTTKKKKHIVGIDYLDEYIRWGKLPHLAISGINLNNIKKLKAAGAHGAAVSSCVCSAEDPAQVVRNLKDALSS